MQDSRRLPQDSLAEQRLIGALLMYELDRDQGGSTFSWDIDEVLAIVGPEAFILDDHATIFRCIVKLYRDGAPILPERMPPKLDAIRRCDHPHGWPALLAELTDGRESANGPAYARYIREAWQKRQLIRAGQQLIDDVYCQTDNGKSVADLIAETVDRLERIDEATAVDREPPPVYETLPLLENPANVKGDEVPVGLGYFGRILCGGLNYGTLTVIGARPSCGKTSLGLGLSLHAIKASDGCPAGFFSAEMPERDVRLRVMSMLSGLPMIDIRSGRVEDEEFNPAKHKAVNLLKTHKWFAVDDVTREAHGIAYRMRRYRRRHGVRLFLVDFLQRLNITGDYDREVRRLGAICKLLKNTSLETQTASVLLSQLSRSAADEAGRPQMSDLRESGEIEEDADNVILIQKPKDEGARVCETQFHIVKQRQGETGGARVLYRKDTMSYEAYIAKSEPEFSCAGAEDQP